MYRPLFTYSVMLATALLVLHSWLFRGPRNTLIFWGVGYLAGFVREFFYQNFTFVCYTFGGTDLKVLNVPITIPMGWAFEAYCSLYVAQFLLGADARSMAAGQARITIADYRKRVLPVILLACAINASIVYAIENTSVRMRWWTTLDGRSTMDPNWILGHSFTVFWLLTLLVYLGHPPLRARLNALYVVVAVAFISVVELNLFRAGGPRWVMWGAWFVIAAYAATFVNLLRKLLAILVVVGGIGGLLAFFALTPLARLGGLEDFVDVGVFGMLCFGVALWRTQRPEAPAVPSELL